MSFAGGPTGFQAIKALVDSSADFRAVADKDWAAAAGLIVKKLLNAAGQTAETLNALRAAVGEDIFDTQLKTLSHHQAKLLAKRLDRGVADIEVSTARASIAHIRTCLVAPVSEDVAIDPPTDQPETVTDAPADDTPPSPPAGPNPYFGRKSFRTG